MQVDLLVIASMWSWRVDLRLLGILFIKLNNSHIILALLLQFLLGKLCISLLVPLSLAGGVDNEVKTDVVSIGRLEGER